MDYTSINPDYQSLKLTLYIAGSVIVLLLGVVAYFLRKQIEVSETLVIVVNNLTTTVKLIEKEQSERDPRTEKRLNEHSVKLNKHELQIARLEMKCNINNKAEETS